MLIDKILSEITKIRSDLISDKLRAELKEQAQSNGVAVWGTGRAGVYALNYCRDHCIQVTCAVDSFSHEEGCLFQGIPLYSAEYFFEKFPNVFVLIACSFGYGIDRLLQNHGYQYDTFDTNLNDYASVEMSYSELVSLKKEEIEAVYALLADDVSRETYEGVIKYRLTMNTDFIQAFNTQPIYFENDVIQRFHGNAFVDCGAWTGDTLLAFQQGKHSSCRVYYALEPSEENFEQLQATIQSHAIPYAVPLKVGAWDKKDTIRFCLRMGAGSCVSEENGESLINVDSLDNLFHDKEVDFIKMDIEGAERQAILGAKGIIQNRTPIMAFSIYHKVDDLWSLPLLLMEINPNYRLYVRHHSPLGDDTVLYAIPKKD